MIEHHNGQVIVAIYVQPGATKTEWVGMHGNAVKIRLQAPPVDGRANACLIEFVAKWAEVPKTAVKILSGDNARHKRIAVKDVQGKVSLKLKQLLNAK